MSGTFQDKSSDGVESRFWVPVAVGRFKMEEEDDEGEEETDDGKMPKSLEKREADESGNDTRRSAWLPPDVETMNLVELPTLGEDEVFVFNPKQTGKISYFVGKQPYICIFQAFTASTTICPPGAG